MFSRVRAGLSLLAAAAAHNKFDSATDDVAAALNVFVGHDAEYMGHLGAGAYGSVLKVRVTPGQPGSGGKDLPWEGERIVAVKVALVPSTDLEGECEAGAAMHTACPNSVLRYYPSLKHKDIVKGTNGHFLNVQTCALDVFPQNTRTLDKWIASAHDPADAGKDEARLHAEDRLHTLAMLGEALECIHREGYYHGDASPANLAVYFSETARVQNVILFDFGTTRKLGETPQHGGTPCACARPREWGSAFEKADDLCTASIDSMAVAQVGAELLGLHPLEPVLAALILAGKPERFTEDAATTWSGKMFKMSLSDKTNCDAMQKKISAFMWTNSAKKHVASTEDWQKRDGALEMSNEVCRWDGSAAKAPELVQLFIPAGVKVEDAVQNRGPLRPKANADLETFLTEPVQYPRRHLQYPSHSCNEPLDSFDVESDNVVTSLCHEFVKTVFNLTTSNLHRSMTTANAAEAVLVKHNVVPKVNKVPLYSQSTSVVSHLSTSDPPSTPSGGEQQSRPAAAESAVDAAPSGKEKSKGAWAKLRRFAGKKVGKLGTSKMAVTKGGAEGE